MDQQVFAELNNGSILYQKYIFFETHMPILFLCESNEGCLYICVMFDDRDGLNWIASPTNLSYLDDMVFNKITLRKLFELSVNISAHSWLLWISNKDLKTKQVEFSEINPLDLPSDDYFDADINEVMDYVHALNRFYFRRVAPKTDYEFNAKNFTQSAKNQANRTY